MDTNKRVHKELEARGLHVKDLRGSLTVHPLSTYRHRPLDGVIGVVFHHSATEQDGNGARTVKAINEWHVSHNDWPGIGYWACIDAEGTVFIAHDLETASYAQGYAKRRGDENAQFVGVCLLGNYRSPDNQDGTEPTSAQLFSALAVWEVLKAILALDPSEIHGHFEMGKPTCPGSTFETVIRAIQYREGALHSRVRKETTLQVTKYRQSVLAELGYTVTVDGIWGPQSRKALVAFQKATPGLAADGVWGPKTEAAIRSVVAKGRG